MATVHGIVLAAGAGSRMGRPKALMREADGSSWLGLATDLLRGAGSSAVTIVLGARADEARALVPDGAGVTVAAEWQAGLSASLRSGLAVAAGTDAVAVLVTLVDLPSLPVSVARRVVAGLVAPGSLRQAVFAGRPGHPVLIGREHWAPLASALAGDRGARPYLVANAVVAVECGDLASGVDVDSLTRGVPRV